MLDILTQKTVNTAVETARAIAADADHGYDQTERWGPDYDCSSLVIHVWRAAGVPLQCSYTGDMRGDMLRRGFTDVTAQVDRRSGAGLCRGDVLLNCARHTALYIGDGRIVHASANERGGATGGMTGDQTGREICERAYFNYPWDFILRYTGGGETAPGVRTLRYTDGSAYMSGEDVYAAQRLLRACGYTVAPDGEYGGETRAAVAEFQRERWLTEDGVCGAATWAALAEVQA